MRALLFCLFFLAFHATFAGAQSNVTPADNTDLFSNSQVTITPGNYTLADSMSDGLLRIEGQHNIVIDGAGVSLNGQSFSGYMLRIHNADSITIRNFESVSGFFYAVYITESRHITIENCNFNWNKVDSSGWISIWTDYDQALGGGALFYNCENIAVRNCTMQYQNDGVALYRSKHADVHDNNFSWNTSYGIRMFWTDSSYIHHNNCAHVNRPYTDPSDCAALLMLVSNNNRVEHNDLSYSGDGVFLGQYEHSNIPNNNYFAYNECSYSPHNAIEATFADGNVYKHNKCNFSHYGLWLGYSFNTVVDSNEIISNQYSGIAVDRGYSNRIRGNTILNNPTGIELWEGGAIAGYANSNSRYYTITGNTIEGNTTGIDASASERSIIRNNQFLFNRNAVSLDLNGTLDSINGNLFRGSTVYHIDNHSPHYIMATGNSFAGCDTAITRQKILDDADNPTFGVVGFLPAVLEQPAIQYNPEHDLAEPPAHWNAYAEQCWGYGFSEETTVNWDSTLKKSGAASVHLRTGNGWYLALGYHPGADSTAQWVLNDADTLKMWLRTVRQIPYGFQFFHLRLGDNHGGWFEYTAPTSLLNNAHLSWKQYKFPLSGNSTWVRSANGNVSLSDIGFVELWADTWDFGFDLWVDGLSFGYLNSATAPAPGVLEQVVLSPNPSEGVFDLRFKLASPETISFAILDMQGRLLETAPCGAFPAGEGSVPVSLENYPPGIYLCRVSTGTGTKTLKLLVH